MKDSVHPIVSPKSMCFAKMFDFCQKVWVSPKGLSFAKKYGLTPKSMTFAKRLNFLAKHLFCLIVSISQCKDIIQPLGWYNANPLISRGFSIFANNSSSVFQTFFQQLISSLPPLRNFQTPRSSEKVELNFNINTWNLDFFKKS